jgi:hypothetical protein
MMKAVDPIARTLLELINKRFITQSALGVRALSALKPLFHTGALKEERRGAGWRIVVANPDAVMNFANSTYPQGLEAAGISLDRSEAVAVLRNSKRGTNLSGEPVLIRGFSEARLISQKGELELRSVTDLCGAACFVLSDRLQWNYEGDRVALVENLEPFLRFEEQFKDFDAAIYCAGRMSVRFLNWLESQSFDIVHFGDYDPVGLQEYLRLKRRTGDRATFYVPQNLRGLVQRYGKSGLLRDSAAILSGLRQEDDDTVKAVLQCLEDSGLGLEQEILWAELDDGNGS